MGNVKVTSVHKDIAGTNVLKNISFKLESGAVLGVVGPNGAGKSTLLEVLSGLVRPGLGEVLLEGRDIHCQPAAKKHIRYCAQNDVQFLGMTGLQALQYFAQVYETKVSTQTMSTAKALNMLDMLSRKVSSYSFGQKRKLSLLSCTLGEPKLALLDEPTASLDIPACNACIDLIRQLCANGCSVIAASHDPDLLAAVAKYVLVLKPAGEWRVEDLSELSPKKWICFQTDDPEGDTVELAKKGRVATPLDNSRARIREFLSH